jgi:hypothetical protein
MSRDVIGIDIGVAGALALVSREAELLEVVDMPILRDGSAGRASVNAPLLAEAIRRWPDKAALFARVKDDGRAEAALIAVAGLRREGG